MIRIDREVYAALRELSKDFRDTPNRVLRRVLGLGADRGSGADQTLTVAGEPAAGLERGEPV